VLVHNMPPGNYKIRNVHFDTQYADLVNGDPTDGTKVIGHHEDDSVAGIDHRIVRDAYH
jgi:hypothetical protein